MAKPSGKWVCSADTPVGRQEFVLTIKTDGDTFRGQASGGLGAMKIDGTVNGDTIAWSMGISKPMALKLTCQATVAGDRLEGKVKAGIFGSYAITGTRDRNPTPPAA